MAVPLSNFAVMRTSDADECRNAVTQHIVPHDFRIKRKGNSFKALLNNVRLTASTITYLRYSTGVMIGSAADDAHYLIVVPLSGTIRFLYEKSEAQLTQQRGVVIEPGHPFNIETNVHSSALIWKVPRRAVERATLEVVGTAKREPVRFDPYLDWQSRRTSRFLRSLHFVAQELDDIDLLEEGAHHQVGHLEQLLIRTLIAAQPNNLRDDPAYRGTSIAPGCVRKVEEYIAENSGLPLAIADLATVASVSARSLHRSFKKFRGISPMSHLRDVRLHRIRADLLNAGPTASVSDILALRGMFQFGRFAAAYRDRFGETPSQTLRRS